MNKKITIGAAITIAAIVATIVFSITMVFSQQLFNTRVQNLASREGQYNKLAEINRIVNENYLNTDAIDSTNLNDSVAKGYMKGIGDPYADYYSIAQTEDLNRNYSGTLVGIGAQYRESDSGYAEIVEVFKDSPAEAVGLQAGDLIIRVGDTDVLSLATFDEVLALLSGDTGSKVNITYRRGQEETTVEVTRRSVEVPTVYYRMLEGSDVGFIKITSFKENTDTQFNTAVDELVGSGAKGLIFDVRDNTGGTMNSTIAILNKLLPQGLIMTATYADGRVEETNSTGPGITLPMEVITNERTASAAELFTLSLKDFEMAQSVGSKTYGKGVMQKDFHLNDGSTVRMTNARFVTKSGQDFNGVGIKPDVEVKLTSDELKLLSSFTFAQISPSTDPQLSKAVEMLGTRRRQEATSSSSPTSSALTESALEESTPPNTPPASETENSGEPPA